MTPESRSTAPTALPEVSVCIKRELHGTNCAEDFVTVSTAQVFIDGELALTGEFEDRFGAGTWDASPETLCGLILREMGLGLVINGEPVALPMQPCDFEDVVDMPEQANPSRLLSLSLLKDVREQRTHVRWTGPDGRAHAHSWSDSALWASGLFCAVLPTVASLCWQERCEDRRG